MAIQPLDRETGGSVTQALIRSRTTRPSRPSGASRGTVVVRGGQRTAGTRGTTAPAPAVRPAVGPSAPARAPVESEEDFWRRIYQMARGTDLRLAEEANRMLRDQLALGNETVRRVLGQATPAPPVPTTPIAPVQDRSSVLLGAAEQAARRANTTPDFGQIVREISRGLQQLVPTPNIPTLEEAAAQVQAAIQPIIDQAMEQAGRDWQQALAAVRAAAAMRGLTGSDPALSAIMDEAQRQQQVREDIAARFGALATEQALNVIGSQLGAFQTVQQAREAAMRNAVALADLFQRARLGDLQTNIGTLLDIARLQESARQANLPFQYPTADTQFTQWLQLWLQSLMGDQLTQLLSSLS